MIETVKPEIIKKKLKFVRENNFRLDRAEVRGMDIINEYVSNRTGYRVKFIFDRYTKKVIRMICYD